MQHPAIAVVKYIPDVFVEDNKTNDVQLVYSGFNCCIVTVSGDDHWIQIVQPRMSTKLEIARSTRDAFLQIENYSI
jgi:hypothetical protein